MLAPPLSRLPRDGRLWIVTTSRTKSVARRSAPERRTSGGSHQRSKARSQPARHASVPDRSLGLPVLGALSLCACCRHYAGAAAGRSLRSSHPTVSAFAERVVGSACTSSFSRLARRSLALRPAHLRRHQFVTRYTEGFSHFVPDQPGARRFRLPIRRPGVEWEVRLDSLCRTRHAVYASSRRRLSRNAKGR
jgi:hypothetical protein